MRKLGLLAQSANQAEEMRFNKYISSLKDECAKRLVQTIFSNDAMDLKYWLGFARRPFLGQRFNNLWEFANQASVSPLVMFLSYG